MLNFLCSGLGLVWLACLPYVSITTLELKPRSLFFDETTLAPLAARSTIDHQFDEDLRFFENEAPDFDCMNETCVVNPASDGLALIGSPRAAPFVWAMATFFRRCHWLDKGVVVAVTDDLGAWVDMYHGVGRAPRSGPLRAALVIDYGDSVGRVRGANAAMPNLDFVHLTATALDLRLGGRGPHAHFLKYGIDAMTIEVPPTRRTAVGVELIFRSLNNVEHDLHHSFFMYWLLNRHHFVSVNEYAWPLMLLVAAFALTAFDAFVSSDLSLVLPALTQFVVPLVFGSSCFYGFFEYRLFLAAGYLVVVILTTTDVRPLILLYWAYAHAALVLLHPGLCVMGTLLGLPFLVPSKRLQRVWWVATFVGFTSWLPQQSPRLAADAAAYEDCSLAYLGLVVVPCHALILTTLL